MRQNQFNKRLSCKGSTLIRFLISTVVLLLMCIVAVVVYLIYTQQFSDMTKQDASDETNQAAEQFKADIQKGGELLGSGNALEATAEFKRLVDQAQTPEQEGQAKLNLGVARLRSDRAQGVELLKEVSINDTYTSFTRAKAIHYITSQYIGSKDVQFALEHIFIGPVWEDFLHAAEENNLTEGKKMSLAVLNALEYSSALEPTVEISMRTAAEYAFLIWDDQFTPEQKDVYAEKALHLIEAGDGAIAKLKETDKVSYGNTHFAEVMNAYNSKGMALDVLYFKGYIDDLSVVEDAFQDALEIAIENSSKVPLDIWARYNYADFLYRLDAEGRRDSITKILAPTEHMFIVQDGLVASFFKSRILKSSVPGKEKKLSQPDSIKGLANISSEFRDLLLRMGVSEGDL